MKKSIEKWAFSRIPWIVIAIVLLASMAAVITAGVQQTQSGQSFEPAIPKVAFHGEYKVGDGPWQDLTEGKHISATGGTVELKGVFQLYDPKTGENWGAVEPGTVIYFYLDHLKASVKDSDGNTWYSDNENAELGKGACAEVWTTYEFTGTRGSEVTVILYNPHVFGNEKSVDGFLKSLQIYRGESYDTIVSDFGSIQIGIALLLFVFFFILFGIALISSVFHVKYEREIWLAWLMVLFGEIYFIFSSNKIGILNDLYAVNTMMLGFSMMLYLLVASAVIASFLYGAFKRIATVATAVLGGATLISVIVSTKESVRFYDVYPYWIPVAVCVAAVLAVCTVLDTLRRGEKRGAREKKYVLVSSLAVLLAFILDTVATAVGLWQGGVLSMLVLLLTVLVSVVILLRVVPRSIRTILDAKMIEAEKQAMELKLQESHISIMLSQIQPHFLYNTLNSIYQLCETNPMMARSMVNSFSEYLRNNLSSLDEPGLISFETELSHIKTYLEIEKIRFDDTLEIEYDVECMDFLLPVLTVQPIVENAVKHGTSKKRGGGRVRIATREEEDCYVITVSDTGCGFDLTKEKDDGRRHVGIKNVRQRLSNMCGGVLTIESEIGVGTVATVRIPKEAK